MTLLSNLVLMPVSWRQSVFKPGCFAGSETEGSDQQQKHYDSFIVNLPEMTPQALQADRQDLSEDVQDNRSQISPLLLEIPAMVCFT